jgi:hypothetical protein
VKRQLGTQWVRGWMEPIALAHMGVMGQKNYAPVFNKSEVQRICYPCKDKFVHVLN